MTKHRDYHQDARKGHIIHATRKVLGDKRYASLAIILSITIAVLYALSPVAMAPGTSVGSVMQAMLWWQWLLAALVGIGMGLLLTMQAYVLKRNHTLSPQTAATGIVGTLGGTVSALFASVTCSACLVTVLPFIAGGSLLFLVEYQWWIVLLGVALIAASIYMTSKKICDAGLCQRH